VSIRFLTYFLQAFLRAAEKINFENMKLAFVKFFYLNQRMREFVDGWKIGEAEC
jgi:hypothetical protein